MREYPPVPGQQPWIKRITVSRRRMRRQRRRLRKPMLSGTQRRRERRSLEMRRQRKRMPSMVVHHLRLKKAVLLHQVGVVRRVGPHQRMGRDAGHHDRRFRRRNGRSLGRILFRRTVQSIVVAGWRKRRGTLGVVHWRVLRTGLVGTADDGVD